MKDFLQTILDALQYNADEAKEGTHVLAALDKLLSEFTSFTDKLDEIGRNAWIIKTKNRK